MVPIRSLLNRIRWDPAFGAGQFEIGYFDRATGAVHRVAYRDLCFPQDRPDVFEITDPDGQVRRIPLHRVREVLKHGHLIWRRPGASDPVDKIKN